MTPEQVQQAIKQIVGDVEIAAVQAVLIPHFTDADQPQWAVEIKARIAATGEWFQGVVYYPFTLVES